MKLYLILFIVSCYLIIAALVLLIKVQPHGWSAKSSNYVTSFIILFLFFLFDLINDIVFFNGEYSIVNRLAQLSVEIPIFWLLYYIRIKKIYPNELSSEQ